MPFLLLSSALCDNPEDRDADMCGITSLSSKKDFYIEISKIED